MLCLPPFGLQDECARCRNSHKLDTHGLQSHHATQRIHWERPGLLCVRCAADTDAAIVRFCQSKRWNAKKIAKQIQQTAAWRKQVGADLYRTAFIDGKKVLSYPLVVAGLKSCPMLFALGHSKDGCPIDWTAVGHSECCR
jgi:hypothetical protein